MDRVKDVGLTSKTTDHLNYADHLNYKATVKITALFEGVSDTV